LKKANLKSSDIDLIGFHGQSIYHNPAKKKTLIIGNPSLLSELTQINVIADFRSKDISRGGQGAPLVPFYHKALCKNLQKPVAVLNIGGVSNVTYVDENDIIAFDIGPGCALIDDWMDERKNKQFDEGGKVARSGIPNESLLDAFMKNKFFSTKPPKSLDRNKFKSIMKKVNELATEDGAATLTYLTAKCIQDAQKFFPKPPKKWIVCGGGSKNLFLMDILRKQYNFDIINLEDFHIFDVASINPDFVEAQAFGFLAVRSYYNLPLSAPYTTGVSSEVSGGAFYRF
nr:anhydro-N-acetylmuramic acid kinase [Alphaproteobacteria bacterium]